MSAMYSSKSELFTFFQNQSILCKLKGISAREGVCLAAWVQSLHQLMVDLPNCDRGRFLTTPKAPSNGRMRDLAKLKGRPDYFGLTLPESLQERVTAMFSEEHHGTIDLLKRFFMARHRKAWNQLRPLSIEFTKLVANPGSPVIVIRYNGKRKKRFSFVI